MYDFLLSEVWWVETIIAALITGILALLGSMLVYSGKIQDIKHILSNQHEYLKSLSGDREHLSEEHKNLSNEHKSLSNEHQSILEKNNDLLMVSKTIEGSMIKTERNMENLIADMNYRKGREGSLSEQEIIKSMASLQDTLLSQLNTIKESQDMVTGLKNEIEILKEQNAALEHRVQEYKKKNTALQNELDTSYKKSSNKTQKSQDDIIQ